jgi:hypothetical protein
MPAKHQRRKHLEEKGRRPWSWIIASFLVVGLVLFGFFSWRSIWDDELSLTLVIAGPDQLGVLQLNPGASRATLLKLPDNLLLGVAGMGSQYQAKSLWRFGEVEGRPGELVSSSVAAFTGLWIDGYIYDPNWTGEIPLGWSHLWRGSQTTNLGPYDYVRALRFLGQLRSAQKTTLSLPASIQEVNQSPDGYEYVSINEQRLSIFTRENFASPVILSDRRTLSVANGSGVPGMARLMERMTASSGGAVVEIQEAQLQESWCQGRYSGEATGVVKWLEKRVGCQMEASDWQRARSEVEITLGVPWGERFSR